MSRLQKYVHALASGYVVLAVNALFTLGSVPIALHYLGKQEFGVWVMASQMAIYLTLLDFGMASSITRILIDHKDGIQFGRAVFTAWLILVVQAVLIFAVGVLVFASLSGAYGVPVEWRTRFGWMMFALSLLMALSAASRMFSHLLDTHQRQDITNYGQVAWFGTNFVTMAFALRAGFGIFSLPMGQFAGWLAQMALCSTACLRLRLMPNIEKHFDRSMFRDLFRLGRDVFLIHCGAQLVMSSQIILLGRWLGPDAAATWSVCTRPFFLLLSFLFRTFDHSLPVFAEMMARGEIKKLTARFQALIRLTGAAAAVCAVAFVFTNQDFATVWTHGRVGWSPTNDMLLGVWIVLLSVFHGPAMFIITTKQIGSMRFVLILEGLLSICLSRVLMPTLGIPGLIAGFAVGSLLVHGTYGFFRTTRMLEIARPAALLSWFGPVLLCAAAASAGGYLFQVLFASAAPLLRFTCTGGAILLVGGAAIVCWGMDSKFRRELVGRFRPSGAGVAT